MNVKLIIDDNDVTIAGHPSEYLKGYDLEKTLSGHGLKVITVNGEDLDALWAGLCAIIAHKGPAAGKFRLTVPGCYKPMTPLVQLFANARWPRV